MSKYRTILTLSEGLYKDKGSKFYAFLHPIATEELGKELLKSYKKKYFDARHHCYALILGPSSEFQKYSDDGEPAHTAGTPILNRLKSAELTNVICIVVRFFGGTKLGVPGLIEAYKSATEAALASAEIVEKEVTETLWLSADYLSVNEVMRTVKNFDAELISQDYRDQEVDIHINISSSKKQEFIGTLRSNYKIHFKD